MGEVNRATNETMRLQATQEGLAPLKTWIKNALDQVIQVCMGELSLEFVWVGDDAVDPLQQAQTLQILVSAGIKTREEARAELGLGGDAEAGLGKFNPNHDERGRFATADDRPVPRIAATGVPHRGPQPNGAATAATIIAANTSGPDVNHTQGASENNSTGHAEIVPICIASGISIATDEFGNKLERFPIKPRRLVIASEAKQSRQPPLPTITGLLRRFAPRKDNSAWSKTALTTCYYDCFNGESFIRTLRGAVGCIPVRQPR